jgi:hypothetical protein
MAIKFIYFTKKRLIVHSIVLCIALLSLYADSVICSYYVFCEVLENIYALILLEFIIIFPKLYMPVFCGLVVIEIVYFVYQYLLKTSRKV